jgi:outer membrane protein TolC/energy-coupling factor transporter ATP-binding protein EcfA2
MIELKNVARSYKSGHTEEWVLRRIGLTIREEDFVTIMGPSGAGKSSLLDILALLDDGWKGEYRFGDIAVRTLNRRQRSDRIGGQVSDIPDRCIGAKSMKSHSSRSVVLRLQAVAAILLVQVSLAFAAAPPQSQSAPQNSTASQPAPEAPAPAAVPASPGTAAASPPTLARQMQQSRLEAGTPQRPFHVELPHSHSPLAPYKPSEAPPLDLTNSPRLQNLIRDGKLYISLRDAIALAIENNLDLAWFRYNFPIAQTDYARTKAGGSVNGVDTGIVQSSTEGGFAGSNTGTAGAGSGSAAAGAGGLVTSTLGAGTAVASFDPYLNFKGFADHDVTEEGNAFQNGVLIFKQNTIEALANFSQNFPMGTALTVNFDGQRFANNSPYEAVNPTLYSNFQVILTQQLLAGFGISTNERYMHIAKKNLRITDLAFRAQVIATITQVENIYWDLVNAYQDEQVKERSLAFAQRTLDDDRKQLQLQAIPALQVSRDESDVAASEGDLTVSRATLRLNELLIENALTKTDDAAIDEMPVVPLDRAGPPDANASRSIDDLIAEAEKNRPDVTQDELAMQVAEMSLKSIRSELLPSLNVYGFYEGAGIAGPKNPNCGLGTVECTSDLPTGFGSMFQNTFNYSSPEYQFGMNLSINLRNRVAKADQFRASLEFRQRQIAFEEQKKSIRFDVRNSLFAFQQAQARVDAATKSRDLAQHTFDVTQQEQQLGARSSSDTLAAEHDLSIAESLLVAAQTASEKAKVDIDRATGETLDQTGVSIDDAKMGVVSHQPY